MKHWVEPARLGRSFIPGLLLGCGFALLAPVAGMAAIDTTALFPDAQNAPRADGHPIRLSVDGRTVVLDSVRFAPRPGRSEAHNTIWCGLVIEQSNQPPQPLVTIGVGDTEAVSCDGLAQAAVLRRSAGGATIGLLYRTHSPNAASQTPVVLVRHGAWSIDTAASDRLSELPGRVTMDRMRADLGRH